MLRVATSYFYQVRFFKPYMIPISTAVWDPKWYHENLDQNHCYIDSNGVINGLRISPLMPGKSCDNLCRGIENCSTGNPETCEFLIKYYEQLCDINFGEFMVNLEKNVNKVQRMLKFKEQPIAVILVHEKYDKACSERGPIQRWFREHGLYVCELMYPINDHY